MISNQHSSSTCCSAVYRSNSSARHSATAAFRFRRKMKASHEGYRNFGACSECPTSTKAQPNVEKKSSEQQALHSTAAPVPLLLIIRARQLTLVLVSSYHDTATAVVVPFHDEKRSPNDFIRFRGTYDVIWSNVSQSPTDTFFRLLTLSPSSLAISSRTDWSASAAYESGSVIFFSILDDLLYYVRGRRFHLLVALVLHSKDCDIYVIVFASLLFLKGVP